MEPGFQNWPRANNVPSIVSVLPLVNPNEEINKASKTYSSQLEMGPLTQLREGRRGLPCRPRMGGIGLVM